MSTFKTNEAKDRANQKARERYANKKKGGSVNITGGGEDNSKAKQAPVGSLAATALLVQLSFSIWEGEAYDEQVSGEVAEKHNTEKKAGRYKKNLLAFNAGAHAEIRQAYRALRSYHERNTRKWARGIDIISGTNYDEYNVEMTKRIHDFDKAVRKFLGEYEELKKEAKKKMNGLYKEEDWPEVNDLKRRFGVSLNPLPVPTAGDIRVALHGETLKSVQAQIESSVTARTVEVMQGLWKEIQVAIKAITKGLKDDSVRQPMFSKLDKLCSEGVAKFNFTGDKALERFAASVRTELGSVQAKEVREDKELKTQVAAKAKELARQMAQFMS